MSFSSNKRISAISKFVVNQKTIGYFVLLTPALVIAIAIAAYVGWNNDISLFRSWTNDTGGMNPMTSICLIILSLFIFLFRKDFKWKKLIVLTGVSLVCFIVVLKYLFDFNIIAFSIEKFFLPGITEDNKIAHPTAISLLLLSMWFFSNTIYRFKYDFILPLVSGFIAFSSFHGHLFGNKIFYAFTMAFNSSFCLLVLSVTILLIKKNPLSSLLNSTMVGGQVARLFFIALFIIVPGFGFIVKELIIRHQLPIQNGISFMITGIIIAGSIVIIYAGDIFNRTDNQRIAYEQKNASLALLIKSITIPIITFDSDFKIISWNLAAEKLYGFLESEAKGQLFPSLFEFHFISNTRDEILKILDEKKQWTGELKLISKDRKEFNILTSIAVIQNENNTIVEYIALHKDISFIKAYEKEISELNEELKTSNEILQSQVYDLESFAGTASHDLKSPLGNIIVLSELLISEHANNLDDTAKQYLEYIKQRAKFMNLLIQDLLKLSSLGIKKASLVEVDLNEALKSAIESIINMPGHNEDINLNIKTLDNISGDPLLITQVFTNLISNAIKYTVPGQKIIISVTGILNGDYYTVIIKDNGIGINSQFLNELFTPFKRFHSGYEGTGLGLTIVKKIMEKLSGSIQVESQENMGTSVFLNFVKY